MTAEGDTVPIPIIIGIIVFILVLVIIAAILLGMSDNEINPLIETIKSLSNQLGGILSSVASG